MKQKLSSLISLSALAALALTLNACLGSGLGNPSAPVGTIVTNPTATPTPVPVPVLHSLVNHQFTALAASNGACFIGSNQLPYCWGADPFGVRPYPLPVGNVGSNHVQEMAVSASSVYALYADGTVHSWGYGGYGSLGNGQMGDSFPAVAVTGLTGTGTEISAGQYFACALIADGTVNCWGRNNIDQLGNNTTTNSSTATLVMNVSHAIQIASGFNSSCALINDGTVSCWGNGVAVAAPVSGLSNVTMVAAGGTHSCALISDGTVQCWGTNNHGQLGNNTTTTSATPVMVSGISTATSIYGGRFSTCAVLADETVQCWGYNGDGEVGDGSTTDRHVPVAVSGLSNVKSLALAQYAACALLNDNSIQCWGSGGTITGYQTADLDTPTPIVQISTTAPATKVVFTGTNVAADPATSGQFGSNTCIPIIAQALGATTTSVPVTADVDFTVTLLMAPVDMTAHTLVVYTDSACMTPAASGNITLPSGAYSTQFYIKESDPNYNGEIKINGNVTSGGLTSPAEMDIGISNC